MKSPGSEPLMMESQLGRMILAASASTEDEMSAAPDQDGRYGPIDGLLEEIATRVGDEPPNSRRSTAGTAIVD